MPGGQPKQIKILGEDLVLFRDEDGKAGLVGLHCSHRLVSLAYGRVEDGGIRCPMHGWLYDVAGHCLEQPAEPDYAFKDRIRHPAYPCRDLGGLIFTYMGPPDKIPLLPNYEVLVRTDGTRRTEWYDIGGGYLQHLEGALDTIHAGYLHMANWSEKKHELAKLPKPKVDVAETDYGMWSRIYKAHRGAVMGTNFSHFIMPAGFLLQSARDYNAEQDARGQATDTGRERPVNDIAKSHTWYVPVDDGNCMRFRVNFAPLNEDGTPVQQRPDGELVHPRQDQDFGRDYYNIDSISGIDPTVGATFRSQDTMANLTQGFPYMDRTKERLGAHDQPLTITRMIILKAIADVQKGLDPKHIIRAPEENEIVYIRGNDPQEYFNVDLKPAVSAAR
jgi:phenylpropionate dioxygenase-like ring-hydroxylating dioxygenase large terminal subunit